MNEIEQFLYCATQHDAAARAARRSAGRLLGTARAIMPAPEFDAMLGGLGIDRRTAALLIEQGAGGRVRP